MSDLQAGAVKIVPNAQYLDGKTPVIKWDGQDWPIPLLAPAQNRFVIPAVLRTGKVLANLKQDLVTAEQMDDLYQIIYWGLKRAHPMLKRETFDNISMAWADTLIAVQTISLQTGVVERRDTTENRLVKEGENVPLSEGPAEEIDEPVQ